jgi:hypothetical protein
VLNEVVHKAESTRIDILHRAQAIIEEKAVIVVIVFVIIFI